MIELRNLSKSYILPGNIAIPALKDINLSVKSGEIFGIIGESGAGKSTLIRSVNLLETPSSGQVIVDGQELTQLQPAELRAARRKIGMIFQHFNLLNSRTVYQNIAFPLELAGYSKSEISKKVNPLLDLTGLTARKHYFPRQLSGGQKQRVAIARALADEPKVLLSDEATSALDPETKYAILELLKEINQRLGLTILLITHEMSVIKQICHRVAILEHGVIAAQSAVLDFFNQPNNAISKKFIRSQAISDLPRLLQQRIVTVKTANSLPLWQLSFFGKTAEQPVITQLISQFGLTINILQGQIETISEEMVGVMVMEVNGPTAQLDQAITYLETQNIHVEIIGYVDPPL